jgi:DNA-binding response OmpR family regulator
MKSGAAQLESLSPGCVVLVGPSGDSREVLTTALMQRGLATYSAGQARTALRLIREHEPDVVVLDGETTDASDSGIQAELEAQLAASQTPLIVLGRVRGQTLLPRQILAKPYHFAPLVHTIQELAAAKAA